MKSKNNIIIIKFKVITKNLLQNNMKKKVNNEYFYFFSLELKGEFI